MARAFSRIRAAAVDGRLGNVYSRKDQLERLHLALVQNSREIQEAIAHDTGNTIDEARIEYSLALSCVKEQYASVDPAQELQNEYLIANGIDSPQARQPAGLVYIDSTFHTPFYSVISPLCAAVASGNCVILKLQYDLRRLTGVLRKILLEALDNDIFDVSKTDVHSSDLLPGCVRVLQFASEQVKPTDLVSPSGLRTVAVVDRTANLDKAAKDLVMARFSFGGKSPYAPDIVLVNDFMMGKFLHAVVQHSVEYHSTHNVVDDSKKEKFSSSHSGKAGLSNELLKHEYVRLVSSDPNGTVIELNQRTSIMVNRKIGEPLLCVHAVSSLEDAIELANKNETLLAAYYFADRPSCKYLGQFIDSQVAFANHVPGELLVGPAGPLNYPLAVNPRYPSTLFTVPRPRYVNCSPISVLVCEVLQARKSHAGLEELEARSQKLPASTKRPSGEMLGFFEQGLVTGAVVAFAPILVALGAAVYLRIKA